mmetsp:Transcript_12677/g.16005  ORF Transcript_12677/g.16005 Transcript_12677/m.16005 type:complete len:270 (+) Transcript_12677:22-831(+)
MVFLPHPNGVLKTDDVLDSDIDEGGRSAGADTFDLFMCFHFNVLSPIRLTISAAASGAPFDLAAALSAWRVSSLVSQSTTSSAIPNGSESLQNIPNFPSRTKSTLPSSWPGKKLVSMIGSPTDAASAIVPGPAFEMRMSAATIYSAMFVMNPSPTTFTSPVLTLLELNATASTMLLSISSDSFNSSASDTILTSALSSSMSLTGDNSGRASASVSSSESLSGRGAAIAFSIVREDVDSIFLMFMLTYPPLKHPVVLADWDGQQCEMCSV